MGCGASGYPGVGVPKNELGNYTSCLINGTDSDIGVINMTTQASDFILDPDTDYSDKTFKICIETTGPIEVQLADGSNFTITQIQTDNNLGQWLPLNILKVYKTGTTGTFSVGH